MITDKKALDCAKTLVVFCQEQGGCQNCIFHVNKCDHWDCRIGAIDLKYSLDEIESNITAKKKNHGYL